MIKDNRMIYPPISELTDKGQHNRYELVIAVAKGARKVTSEYLEMRGRAEKMISDRETEKSLLSLIDAEYRDQKAVRIAITRLHEGKYKMLNPAELAALEAEEAAAAEGTAE
jgi:DNA-directed RNA polymerase subunit K/omega